MDLIGWLVCDYIRRNLVTLSIWWALCVFQAHTIAFIAGLTYNLILGSKDISIFGAAHTLNQETLRSALLDEYPDIAKEQNGRGLLAFIRDRIINLDFVYNNEGVPAGREPQTQPTDPEKNLNTIRKDTVEIS